MSDGSPPQAEKIGTITSTTRVPRLWDEAGNFKEVQLVAWSNGIVTWEPTTEINN